MALALGSLLLFLASVRAEAGGATTYCSSPAAAIPDGVSFLLDFIIVPPGGPLEDITVDVDISHSFVGDLSITLTNAPSLTAILLDPSGCSQDDVLATFSDGGTAPAQTMCNPVPPAISGAVTPLQPLSTFAGTPSDGGGGWFIFVQDFDFGETGTLNEWCVTIDPLTEPPEMIFDHGFEDPPLPPP